MNFWTSANDKLPEEGERVLACSVPGDVFFAQYVDASKSWYREPRDSTLIAQYVSYWASIPPIPEKSI